MDFAIITERKMFEKCPNDDPIPLEIVMGQWV
jgi:hypothetical protein